MQVTESASRHVLVFFRREGIHEGLANGGGEGNGSWEESGLATLPVRRSDDDLQHLPP